MQNNQVDGAVGEDEQEHRATDSMVDHNCP